jgi:hypothetical protein
VTPPPFRRGKCDGRHSALLRCNACTRLIIRLVVPNGLRELKHEPVDDVGFMRYLAKLSDSCLVPRCENKDAKLSICSLVPYQNEMLMPHCRHDFSESCPSWAPFEVTLFELSRVDSRSLIRIHLINMAVEPHGP